MTLDNAPVCLDKWKLRSKLCRCKKTFLAIFLMDCWATLANTALRISFIPAAEARHTPSKIFYYYYSYTTIMLYNVK